MRQFLKRLWREERGESIPEYALLVVLICLTAISTVGKMAAKVNNICANASTQMSVSNNNSALTGRSVGYSTESPADPQSGTKFDTKTTVTH